MTYGISIILCCYNSATRLPETLRHLAAQSVSEDIAWEIIVVDNNSIDNTYILAKQEWQQYDLPNVSYTVLSEPRPRKYFALTTGVNHAKYEYIIICDDDNWLNPNYINQAFHTINTNERFAAVGGQGIAVSDEKIPSWFWEHQSKYAIGSQNNVSGDVSAKGYLWGAGMVFRKSLYKKVNHNLPSILLGPTQNESARAEDVELCMRFLMAGYLLYYDDELVFKHFIPNNRLTNDYKQELLSSKEYENRVLNLYRKQIWINNLSLLEITLLFCKTWFRYFICKIFPQIQRWHYVYEAEVIYLLSKLEFSSVSDEARKIGQLNTNLKKGHA